MWVQPLWWHFWGPIQSVRRVSSLVLLGSPLQGGKEGCGVGQGSFRVHRIPWDCPSWQCGHSPSWAGQREGAALWPGHRKMCSASAAALAQKGGNQPGENIFWALREAHVPSPGQPELSERHMCSRSTAALLLLQCRGLCSSCRWFPSSPVQLPDRQRLLLALSLGQSGLDYRALLLTASSSAPHTGSAILRSPAPSGTAKKCISWWNSLWTSHCASKMLLLDYFYSYNPNGSPKIKPDVIFCLFSAECSVTVVLSVSLQNTNITWIGFDFSVDPVFPPQCHLGFLVIAAFCSLQREVGASQEVALCYPVITSSRGVRRVLSAWVTTAQLQQARGPECTRDLD